MSERPESRTPPVAADTRRGSVAVYGGWGDLCEAVRMVHGDAAVSDLRCALASSLRRVRARRRPGRRSVRDEAGG
jgi:hypothetical protein